MSSIAAKEVAKEVLETIGRGERPNLQKILKNKGYSSATARGGAKQVVESKSFQEVINPVVQSMILERDAAILRMKKVRNKAKYRDLTDATDKLTKNIQLLNGGKTSNDGVQLSWE